MAQHVDTSGRNVSVAASTPCGTQMSFKDWKMQKEGQSKNNTSHKRRQDKCKGGLSNINAKNTMRPPPSLLSVNIEQNVFSNNMPPSFGRPPPYGNNGFNSGRNYAFNGNGFRCGNNFNGSNSSSGQSPSLGHYQNTGNINFNLSDRFFQTDDFYHQKDMLQAPSPFRYNHRLNELASSRNSSDSRKPRVTEKTQTKHNEKPIKTVAPPKPAQILEPTIFVRNPNRKDIKKPFLPKPKHPETEPDLTTEERKQQWKDYREAMKPFKNKAFYNARRVVQRLGKKDPGELDEKEKFRLTNAQQKMAEYKQKLAEKYDSYVKSSDKSANEPGELYILRKGNTQSHGGPIDKAKLSQYKNNANFGESYKSNSDFRVFSGRKIVGGSSNYSAFVPGATVDSSSAKL